MSDLLRLLVLIPVGYVAADAAAAVTVALTTFGPPSGLGPVGIVIVSGVMMVYAGAASFVASAFFGVGALFFASSAFFGTGALFFVSSAFFGAALAVELAVELAPIAVISTSVKNCR